jgi:tetraacyldisaccharide 4'-kinase
VISRRAILHPILLPLSWTYGQAAGFRRRAYETGRLAIHRIPAPVISVGALAVGGSGKTPVTRWVADQLLGAGLRVGVVHGGYGGAARGVPCAVTSAARWDPGAARWFGDESILLARWLERAVVVCGRDKVAAARLAVAAGAQVVVVDDGFQHQRLHRDTDIVIHDAAPVVPLPAGRAREPGWALQRADVVWCHRRDGYPDAPVAACSTGHGAGSASRRRGPDRGSGSAAHLADVLSRNVPCSVLRGDGSRVGSATDLCGKRVFLLAGIARPEAFEVLVRGLGARVVGRAYVGDHRRFAARHFRRAARTGAEVLLWTEKDSARMGGVVEAREVLALSCGLEILRGADRAAEIVLGASSGHGGAP